LKRASTTTNMKVARVRAELQTIGTADVNAFAALPQRCCLGDNSAFYFIWRSV